MSSKKIFTAISLVSLGTLISRFFGLGREVVTASFFGTTAIYDAFLLAFMIPNFFRGLLAEGALNAAFIPVFTEYTTVYKDKNKSLEVFQICFTISILLTSILFILTLLASYFATSFISESAKWFWVWTLLRFTFPYLIFISLTALNMGVLNVYKSFFIPSLSPVVLDIFWVGALFLLMPFMGKTLEEKIFGLCIGVVLGGFGQFVFTLIPVMKRGYRVKFNFNFKHPAIKKIGRLLAPVIIGMAVGPINLLIDNSMANLLYEGAVSGLWYSTRVYQLPLGIFAISISTAILPWLSEDISSKNYEGFDSNLKFSLKLLMFLMLPFTFGLIMLRTEIITFLFSRGLFSSESVMLAAGPLAYYSLGLAGYGGISVLIRAFYSCGDTVTPVRIGVLTIFANVCFNALFMKFLGHNGIALSTSLVGTGNFLLLIYLFNKKHFKIKFEEFGYFILKVLIVSAIMGFILLAYKTFLKNSLTLPVLLFSAIIISTLFYLLCFRKAVLKWVDFYLQRRRV
ncbi:murein biosynthesis integral membrane protein MurJ [bacterium]|nr:murein biosynthesis integral membrane protein MurJ [bacterium]